MNELRIVIYGQRHHGEMTKSSTMEAKVIGSFLEQPENAPLLPFSNFREIEMKLDISDDRGQP